MNEESNEPLERAPRLGSGLAEPLLDAKAASELLAVKRSWIYEAVRDGRLPHIRIGKHVRFLRSDLSEWVIAQRR